MLVGHPSVLSKVKSITRDFSALYQKQCDRLFPDAVQVGDKFHVIRHLMDANQALRIKVRQKEVQNASRLLMSLRGLKNYGWKNVREMEKNLTPGNSTTRKHGLKMGRPRWNRRPGSVPALQVSPLRQTQTKDKDQCPVSFVP